MKGVQEIADFPTTAWAFVRVVQDNEHPEHVQAVNHFINAYWTPVFYFLRANGSSFESAQDLTQEFFLRFILERKWIQTADPYKGRFRWFLLTVLKRFHADCGITRTTNQDRFERRFVTVSKLMSDVERNFEPATEEDAEAIFERQWAFALFRRVCIQLRERFTEENRLAWIELYNAYHPATGKRPSQQVLATQFGFSRDQVRAVLAKVQNRLDRLLRAEIRDQVGAESDVEDEIRVLMRAMQ